MNSQLSKGEIQESAMTISLFLFVLLLLCVMTVSNCFDTRNSVAKVENRMMAPLPKLRLRSPQLASFPAAFNAFYNDRFALRTELILAINYLRYKGFSVSNSPCVAIGKHQWLFFLDGGDEETARHYPLFSQEELESWGRTLEARRLWLAARHCKFLFVVAPSKCSIYGEELPAAYKPIGEQSRQDQLLDYLRSNTKVSVIDVRPSLNEAKKFIRLYYYTDTHWTHVGAYVAYVKIAERLKSWFPQIRTIPFSSMRIDYINFANGDLQNMLGLHGLIPETASRALPKSCFTYRTSLTELKDYSEVTHRANAPFATELDNSQLPRAFCLRDSFMSAVAPLLSESFSRVDYYWQQEFPNRLIEHAKPDVVIEELVERELVRWDPVNSPEVNQVFDQEYLAKSSSIDKSKLAGTRNSHIRFSSDNPFYNGYV